jgi:Protein of unknown function (DUF2809)
MLIFCKKYFILTLLLFLTEVLIALFAHDKIIRPYFGDLLVVILLYCLVKSFLSSSITITALSVLLFSYLVETLQYFHLVHRLGLGHSKIANIIIGNYFAWMDILAYTLGILIVFGIENLSLVIRRRGFSYDIRNEEESHCFI